MVMAELDLALITKAQAHDGQRRPLQPPELLSLIRRSHAVLPVLAHDGAASRL